MFFLNFAGDFKQQGELGYGIGNFEKFENSLVFFKLFKVPFLPQTLVTSYYIKKFP